MITKAEAKARTAEADAILQQAVTAKGRGLDLFDDYSVHVGRLLAVLKELAEAEAQIADANRRLATLGDRRSVAGIETSYWTGREPGLVQFPEWSLIAQTRLPDPEVARKLAWPQGERHE